MLILGEVVGVVGVVVVAKVAVAAVGGERGRLDGGSIMMSSSSSFPSSSLSILGLVGLPLDADLDGDLVADLDAKGRRFGLAFWGVISCCCFCCCCCCSAFRCFFLSSTVSFKRNIFHSIIGYYINERTIALMCEIEKLTKDRERYIGIRAILFFFSKASVFVCIYEYFGKKRLKEDGDKQEMIELITWMHSTKPLTAELTWIHIRG